LQVTTLYGIWEETQDATFEGTVWMIWSFRTTINKLRIKIIIICK